MFTGLKLPSPVGGAFVREPSPGKLIGFIKSDKIDRCVEQLHSSMNNMHKEVANVRLKKKEKGENLVIFSVDNYMLSFRVDGKRMNKLVMTRVGPYAVNATYPWSFKIKHLVNGQEKEIHSTSLRFFAGSSLEVTC
jgi:hypothetical protein